MGDPVNFKGDLLNVTVDFGGLELPTSYDRSANAINLVNSKLRKEHIGLWNITIDAIYRERNGTIIKYTSEMWIQVVDPRKKLPEPPQVIQWVNTTQFEDE